jgi:hypothetical protein
VDEVVLEELQIWHDGANLAAHLDGQDWIIAGKKSP